MRDDSKILEDYMAFRSIIFITLRIDKNANEDIEIFFYFFQIDVFTDY